MFHTLWMQNQIQTDACKHVEMESGCKQKKIRISTYQGLAATLYFFSSCLFWTCLKKKSRIRDTSNLLTDADSSTNATVGWTKNTQKTKKKI